MNAVVYSGDDSDTVPIVVQIMYFDTNRTKKRGFATRAILGTARQEYHARSLANSDAGVTRLYK